MEAWLDHVVLWSDDPLRTVEFYERVVGLTPVRRDEYRAGQAPFPSVRVSAHTLIDIMARAAAPLVEGMTGSTASAGHRVNHVCLAMTKAELTALAARLEASGVARSAPVEQSFGARGLAPRAFYFRDPDGNVLEARSYEP